MTPFSRIPSPRRPLQQVLFENLESRRLFDGSPLPIGTQEADIGAVGLAGSTDYQSGTGTFMIRGAGQDLYGPADAFHFVYTSLSGSGEITARVNSITPGTLGGIGGLDLRSTLDPAAENTFAGVRADGALVVNSRSDDGASATNFVVNPNTPPVYLRIIRNGDEVLTLSSPDGTTWTKLADTTLNNLPDTVFVGEAVASEDPTSLAIADIDTVTVAQTTPPAASVTNAPDLTAAQDSPYQFSVTYTDDTTVSAASLGDANLTVTNTNGYSQNATLVSSGLTDGSTIVADYTVPAPTDNGVYTVFANDDQVLDNQGTPLAKGSIGGFLVNIPDTQPPTASLTTAPAITTPLTTPYQFTVTYADNTSVSAASIGNANLNVSGPGGYSQPATLVSTNLVDGPSIVATYSVPAPTAAGIYTVAANASQVTDSSANALAAGAIGTFVDSPPTSSIAGSVVSALSLGPVVGRTVFIDANDNGAFDTGETSAITDANGAFSFTGLPAGTYRVADDLPPGASLTFPAAGFVEFPLGAGQSATGVVFTELPASQASGADLTATFTGKLPTTLVSGSSATVKVKLVNNGAVAASGPVKIALLASSDGSLSSANTVITTAAMPGNFTLKPHASKTVTITFTFPGTLPAGAYFLIAAADSSNVVAETDEANNTASSPITIEAASRDLTVAFAGKVPASLVHGKKANLTVAVSNLGTTPVTGPFSIRLFESADQTLDGSDVFLGTLTTPRNTSILGGKSKNYRISWTTPPAVVFGSEFMIAQVDSANVVAESNENNNTASTTTKTSFS